MTDSKKHVFELAGLGKPPFRFLRYEYKIFQPVPDAPVQVGGSCDYCGLGISHWYWVRSADDKCFKVGSECVKKTGDQGLMQIVSAEERKVKAKIRKERETARIRKAQNILTLVDTREDLREMDHPLDWRAEKGESRLDWAEWMMRFAGKRGKLEVAKFLKKMDKAGIEE